MPTIMVQISLLPSIPCTAGEALALIPLSPGPVRSRQHEFGGGVA
jgi:hypothetical protein